MDNFRKTKTPASSRTSESTCHQSAGQFDQGIKSWNLQDSPVAESVSTEWTDEKHSLYLKSMEASFVNQLYNSTDFLRWRFDQNNVSDIASSRQIQRPSSGQVLRRGGWLRINFQRPDLKLHKAYESAGKSQTVLSMGAVALAGPENRATNSSGNKAVSCYLCHHDMLGSCTEASDQNFIDDEIEGEKASRMRSSKKMKTT
ncbi:cold-regulated protein 27-like [Mangifera indica]|uniref:cold-regulated protein 27-like n=1 Tax=Mangifera indica TaxID=29780 RepID=UPI001CFB7484|nr:cold-regulated protein 27-like [Mangifera indica]